MTEDTSPEAFEEFIKDLKREKLKNAPEFSVRVPFPWEKMIEEVEVIKDDEKAEENNEEMARLLSSTES